MTRFDMIKKKLEAYSHEYSEQDTMVNVWNEICESSNCMDDYIYRMHELDEVLEGTSPADAINLVVYGNFNPNDEYFQFNGYGNLVSSDFPCADFMSLYDMAKDMDDSEFSYGLSDIDEIIEAYDEDGNAVVEEEV